MNLFIKTTPKAEQDLDDLFQYLARENEDTALRFFDSFRETIAQLSKMPNIGKYYQINNPKLKGLRRWRIKGFKQYIIFYLVSDQILTIVRIIYASRDIPRILESE